MKCRHCQADLNLPFLDLSSAPPSNAYLSDAALSAPETWYPLRVLACGQCWLVQTEDYAGREALFTDDYAYFSSFSTSWLAHAKAHAHAMQSRFGLGSGSMVSEIAANDGYLLQYVQMAGIPCYGVEPTAGTAAAARAKGIAIVEKFFSVALASELAMQGRQADWVAANNVLAHVPDINDFVAAFAILLKPQGVATFEFPHLLRMVGDCQFDTTYHEHYSYLSLTAVQGIFAMNGLRIFDVEELATHGGSLRVYAERADTGGHAVTDKVAQMMHCETQSGIKTASFYSSMQIRTDKIKDDFCAFLIEAKRQGKSISAYGAAAKGNTLMNYAGVRRDLISFVADRNPAKQGKYMPGSRIPIVNEDRLKDERPDYVVILPWNLKEEVMQQLDYIRSWGGRFVTAVPELRCVP